MGLFGGVMITILCLLDGVRFCICTYFLDQLSIFIEKLDDI
ncbi:MAG: hypothetical protein P857_135 [Candidatus Xenolissoclinum pacificiensis L6]|uniref:Uncharacterized protein n=1 Tax=Candidatus Xenolissoclinum pacificiensis L6 TaxID=1401685 RepID=W2UYV7_9RICK|nr:MAG: hypothetical protein P857_135 [Candidatus Xenolissoclinum pacificiensis L6]